MPEMPAPPFTRHQPDVLTLWLLVSGWAMNRQAGSARYVMGAEAHQSMSYAGLVSLSANLHSHLRQAFELVLI